MFSGFRPRYTTPWAYARAWITTSTMLSGGKDSSVTRSFQLDPCSTLNRASSAVHFIVKCRQSLLSRPISYTETALGC